MSWFSKFSKSSVPPSLMDNSWRDIAWGEAEAMTNNLKEMVVRHRDVKYLRILVHGQVGHGKSSFINSINSIFQERMVDTALTGAAEGVTFTKAFKVHQIRDGKTREPLRFVLCDAMGLEKGDSKGVHPDDLIKILQGQIKDGHKFNPVSPCSEKDSGLTRHGDKIHCLVSVVPADTVAIMGDDDFKKMRQIREKASEMGISQFVMLTKVDLACQEVKKDIRMVYRSKKIKENMQHCCNKLGVAMNCIFPVKNYHEEIDLNPNMNVLLLSALKRILDAANDHVETMAPRPANKKKSSTL